MSTQRVWCALLYRTEIHLKFLSHIESLAGHSIFADTSHSNVVFLLVQETSCSSCLSEVRWWEENQQNFEDTKIYILVTSKYEFYREKLYRTARNYYLSHI